MKVDNINSDLNVVYAVDDNFAQILGVSIESLLRNTENFYKVRIFIIDGGIGQENKDKIESLLKSRERRLITWLQAVNITEELNIPVSIDRGSITQYARLFISRLIPPAITRVLYLDCDVLIIKSIVNLWNLNLGNKVAGVLQDAFSKEYRRNIQLKKSAVMFNSGVMLIDINNWRKQDIEKKLLQFIIDNKGTIQQGDQGVLNAILYDKIIVIDPKYNVVTIMFDFTYSELLIYRKPMNYYSKEQIERATAAPVIVHFTSSFLSERPWEIGCNHPYKNAWLANQHMTPWKEADLRRNGKGYKVKAYVAIGQILPRKWFIEFSGLLQAYLRPLLFRLKK